MAYYRRCPICKAALDPGEICTDCQDKEKAAPDAANIEGGQVENGLPTNISTPIVQQNKGGFQV